MSEEKKKDGLDEVKEQVMRLQVDQMTQNSEISNVRNEVQHVRGSLDAVKIDNMPISSLQSWDSKNVMSARNVDMSITDHLASHTSNSFDNFIKYLDQSTLEEYFSTEGVDPMILRYIIFLCNQDGSLRFKLESCKDKWSKQLKAIMMTDKLKKE
jgi:hypothetical protein